MKVVGESLAVGGNIVSVDPTGESTKKTFVPFIIPGETAEVAITKDHGSYQEARLLSIIEPPHNDRVIAPCPAFTLCGGCQLQHMTIEQERHIKVEMIASYFKRQTKIGAVNVVSASDGLPEYHYRRRITLHVAHDGVIGFHHGGTRTVVPIRECTVAEKNISDLIPKLSKGLGELVSAFKTIEVVADRTTVIVGTLRDGIRPMSLNQELNRAMQKLSGIDFYVKTRQQTFLFSRGTLIPSTTDLGHFSQVNSAGNQRLHDIVLLHCSQTSHATELYAGSGNFTFALADKGYSVNAVEFDPQLVHAGNAKAEQKKLRNKVQFFQAPCETWVKRNALHELVIMDPPRAGAKDVVRLATWSTVKKMIYISCSLPSFARDAERLHLDHGLLLKDVFFVDMFPRTHHVELVGVFER